MENRRKAKRNRTPEEKKIARMKRSSKVAKRLYYKEKKLSVL